MKSFVLLFALIYSISVFAKQDTTNFKPEGKKYIGVNLGTTTALGLTYIYWPEKNGFQVTFLPLLDKKNSYYSLGLTYLRQIKEFPHSTFFMYVGNHITNMFNDKKNTIWNIGVGPGAEYYIYDFAFHFMIGYAVYAIPDNIMTRPSIEFGAFYKF